MWVNINSGNLETRGLSYGNCTMAWSVSPLQYLRINCASTMSCETSMWRAVCKNLYLVCPQMENKGIYISVSGVWTTTFVCARLDSLFDRQLCVCTMWPNIHPVHPSCGPGAKATNYDLMTLLWKLRTCQKTNLKLLPISWVTLWTSKIKINPYIYIFIYIY